MESFVVSARKYRPQQFGEVVGQDALTNTLRRAIATNKLAGAYLFCGPRGVGKTTCARIFAKTINCLNPPTPGEACEECESCRSFNEGRSLNIQELNASANNSVDDIRAIIDQVRIPPQIGRYKVIILDEVHMLSAAASNALLKTLEEPPSYVIFILATTEKQKILPTILSRCQIFDFNRMTIDNIIQELRHVADKEGIKCDESALNLVAQKADGGMRDALSIFDQLNNYAGGNITRQAALESLNVLDYEYYFSMVDLLLDYKVGDALVLLGDIINKGFDAGMFIGGLASHLRDLLVCKDKVTLPLLDVGSDLRERYGSQAERASQDFLYKAMRACDRCSNDYKNSFNKRLSVELTLIEVAQINGHAGAPNSEFGIQNSELQNTPAAKQLKPLLRDTNGAASQPIKNSELRIQNSPAAPSATKAASQPIKNSELRIQNSPAAPKPAAMPRVPRINLGSVGRKEAAPAPRSTEEKPAEPEEPAPQSLTREALLGEWKTFVEGSIADESVRKRLSADAVEVSDNMIATITVPGQTVADFIHADVRRLEQHLLQAFGDSRIRINIDVRTTERDNGPHTPGEVFADMLGRSEALRKLKDEIGLELE